MTGETIKFLLWAVTILIPILLGLLAYIGKGMIEQLKNIATSVRRIEIDLGILNNDHQNLKERVEHLEDLR